MGSCVFLSITHSSSLRTIIFLLPSSVAASWYDRSNKLALVAISASTSLLPHSWGVGFPPLYVLSKGSPAVYSMGQIVGTGQSPPHPMMGAPHPPPCPPSWYLALSFRLAPECFGERQSLFLPDHTRDLGAPITISLRIAFRGRISRFRASESTLTAISVISGRSGKSWYPQFCS